MCDITNQYYTTNADEFIQATINLTSQLQTLYDKFTSRLGSNIVLDVGCGSGRDSLYFQNHSLIVTAIDKNKSMVAAAFDNGVEDVINVDVEQFESLLRYGGIWACASLLHVKRSRLIDVFKKLASLLNERGVLYCSFKYGSFEGYRNGRYFTDMDECLLKELLNDVKSLQVVEMFVSDDVRGPDRQKWLNVYLKKV